MKKLLSCLLAAIVMASFAACGAGAGTGSADGASSASGGASGSEAEAAPSADGIELTGEITGEITVSAYDTMRTKTFLEDAARLFEEKYPGTTVKVETFSAMPEVKTSEQGNMKISAVEMKDDPQGRADYIGKTSTALMSGGGADLLAMDVLPLHKYAEGGQLENLEAYMAADPGFDRSAYRENILDALAYKGGTWFLPLDYTFDYYAYDSTLLTGDAAADFGTGSAYSTDRLLGIAEDSFDGGAKLFGSPDYIRGGAGGLWDTLLGESYASYVDLENKAAHLDDGSFAALLEAVKEYGEKGYIEQGATGQREAGAMMQRAGEAPSERFFYKLKNVFALTTQYNRGTGRRMNIVMSGGLAGIEDEDEIAGIQANADGSVPFTFEQGYGLNANSQNKETAWAFLRFLLSEEMQLNTNLMPTALPLLNTARQQKAEMILSGAFMGMQGEPLDEAQQKALEQYSAAVEELSAQINAFVFEDTTVNDMIAAEVGYFFDGTKTADEVAKTLQSKVDLYLSE